MKKKDVYHLVIKCIGIWIIMYASNDLKNILSFYHSMGRNSFSVDDAIQFPLKLNIAFAAFYLIIGFSLLFGTSYLIKLLPKSTLNNDESIAFPTEKVGFMHVLLTVLGLYFAGTELPKFLLGMVQQIMAVQNGPSEPNANHTYFWASILKLVFAYFLICRGRELAAFFMRDKKSKIENP